jgi:hypothetical protein
MRPKFTVGELLTIGMTLVVLTIGIAYGLTILGDVKSSFVTDTAGCNSTDTAGCGTEYNATGSGVVAIAKIPAKLGIIVTIILAAVVIGILYRYFAV